MSSVRGFKHLCPYTKRSCPDIPKGMKKNENKTNPDGFLSE